MSKPSIIVLYNQPVLPSDHPEAESERSVVEIADKVIATLKSAGYRASPLALGCDPAVLWSALKEREPSAVFNLFEGNPDHAETETYVAGLLEWAGIPFTGSPAATLALARCKDTTKHLVKGAGLPTADFVVVDALPMPRPPLSFPVIVKPARQDASVGVDQSSVCTRQAQVEERVEQLLKTFGPPVLVEAYIAGREFHVPLMELPTLEALPIMEITFPSGSSAWPILTYADKWERDIPPRFPCDLPHAVLQRLGALAMQAYRLLGCRDYARVDFRMNAANEPFILEVNPNPEISAGAGYASNLGRASLSHHEFIVKLAEQALARGK